MQLYVLGANKKVQVRIGDLGTVVTNPEDFDKSHILIADISKANTDIGFEIGRAEMVMKPVLCLKKHGINTQTPLVDDNSNIMVKTYVNEDEILDITKEFLDRVTEQAKEINSSCCGGGCCSAGC